MAFYTNEIEPPRKQNAFNGIFEAMGRMFESIADAQSRTDAVNRMQDMSDAELAKLGVSRNEIVRYVYRDILHV